MRIVRRKVIAALAERLLMREDLLDLCAVALARHQRMPDRQQNLADYHHRRVDREIKRQADRTLGGVFHRHHAIIRALVVERLEHRRNRRLRLVTRAQAEPPARRFMRIGMLRAEIGDANRALKRGAGGDNLGENPLDMFAAKRPRVVRDGALDYLALARRLIYRRSIGLLEVANLLGDPRPLRKQPHQLKVDVVDLLTQVEQRSLLRQGKFFCRPTHRGKGLTDNVGLFNIGAAPGFLPVSNGISALMKFPPMLQSRLMKAAPIAVNLRSRIRRNSTGLSRPSFARCAASAVPTASIAA